MKKETTSKIARSFTQWRSVFRNYIYSFSFMWKNSKSYLLLSIVDMLYTGLMAPLFLFLNARVYNILEERGYFLEALFILASLTLLVFLRSILSVVFNEYISPKYTQKMQLKIQNDFYKKAAKIELAKYDDPEFYNDFVLAMQYTGTYAAGALGNIMGVLSVLLNISATLALIIYIDVQSMLILVINAVLSLVIGVFGKKLNFEANNAYTRISRKGAYIDRLYRTPDYAKEMRASHIYENAERDYDSYVDEHIGAIKKYGIKQTIYNIIDQTNNNLGYIGVIALMAYKLAVLKTVTLGDFSVFVTSNWNFRFELVQLGNMITGLPQMNREIELVRKFMDYTPPSASGTLPAPTFESIELHDVCFGYNGGEDVLHDVTLKLRRGEKIAIVGYNGAGKSTLIKLLMRLYEPRSGTVMYNGIKADEYEIDSYRSRIGAVFQDYRIFSATVAENVLGDVFTEADRPRVLDALHRATFDGKLTELERGIDTMLTREFDENGTNLSGGEAQKIAIARVFAGNHDIIIMDEPSAALDPMAEYELNKQIAEFAADKTVIFISHRLSTTRHADRIYMFEEGRVIEQGSHDELMRRGGKYAEMFNVQAEKYKLDEAGTAV